MSTSRRSACWTRTFLSTLYPILKIPIVSAQLEFRLARGLMQLVYFFFYKYKPWHNLEEDGFVMGVGIISKQGRILFKAYVSI